MFFLWNFTTTTFLITSVPISIVWSFLSWLYCSFYLDWLIFSTLLWISLILYFPYIDCQLIGLLISIMRVLLLILCLIFFKLLIRLIFAFWRIFRLLVIILLCRTLLYILEFVWATNLYLTAIWLLLLKFNILNVYFLLV